MKRVSLAIASLVILIIATSCGTQSAIIPKALNTVCTASFADLNLTRKDYQILNTVTAEAVVINHSTPYSVKLEDPDGEFSLTYTKTKLGWECRHSGVVRLGYLGNDYRYDGSDMISAEDLARRLAIYRLINVAKQNGADGIIEPTVSTNVEQDGKKIVLKSTVSAKIIKLNTNK